MDNVPGTHRVYPYAFCLSSAYELKDDILFMEYRMENRDQRSIWYAIGAHLGFNYPMEEDFALEDYQLIFKKEENTISIPYGLDQLHFSPSKPGARLGSRTPSPKRGMFKSDIVFFDKLNSQAASVLNPAASHGMEVGFPGSETVAFWTSYPELAPYLCVEP